MTSRKYCRWINVSENYAVSIFRFDPEEGRYLFVWNVVIHLQDRKLLQPTRLISSAFSLRLVHSDGWSNNDCNEGQSGSPFHYSLSHITFILQQKHIRDCAVSSVLHFHRLLRRGRGWVWVGLICRKQWLFVTAVSKWKEARGAGDVCLGT